jgi:acetoin:2,6-dichlorophenolindophenol oxidoreductase subunit alpha
MTPNSVSEPALPLSIELPTGELLRMFESMLRIRLVEERVAELVTAKEIRCPAHLYTGQEAIAVGVCSQLNRDDYVWGGHRSHGHYLAKGGDLRAMMAEMYGKASGCSAGRGGSMHLFAPEVGIYGTVPLVSATIPLAVGSGFASKLRDDSRVSVCFFGDGAVEEGHAHESMNAAALYRLPVIFVCENNLYASHMSLAERRMHDNIWKAAEFHGMSGEQLDGNDVAAVTFSAARAVGRARKGEGPTLLECRTYRWRGHVGASMDMDVGVMRKDELPAWLTRDPIARVTRALLDLGVNESELGATQALIQAQVNDAVEFARSSPEPEPSEVATHVYASRESR